MVGNAGSLVTLYVSFLDFITADFEMRHVGKILSLMGAFDSSSLKVPPDRTQIDPLSCVKYLHWCSWRHLWHFKYIPRLSWHANYGGSTSQSLVTMHYHPLITLAGQGGHTLKRDWRLWLRVWRWCMALQECTAMLDGVKGRVEMWRPHLSRCLCKHSKQGPAQCTPCSACENMKHFSKVVGIYWAGKPKQSWWQCAASSAQGDNKPTLLCPGMSLPLTIQIGWIFILYLCNHSKTEGYFETLTDV